MTPGRHRPRPHVSRLADTSPTSYLETAPVEAIFDATADAAGPVTVAATADPHPQRRVPDRAHPAGLRGCRLRHRPLPGRSRQLPLLLRSVAWLTIEDDLLALSANLPADRPLRLTDARIADVRLLTAGAVPALFLLAGATDWAVRRTR